MLIVTDKWSKAWAVDEANKQGVTLVMGVQFFNECGSLGGTFPG